jgi:hypothetical protein
MATQDIRSNRIGWLVVVGEEVGSMLTLRCHVPHATCDCRVVDGIGELKQALGFSPEKARVDGFGINQMDAIADKQFSDS